MLGKTLRKLHSEVSYRIIESGIGMNDLRSFSLLPSTNQFTSKPCYQVLRLHVSWRPPGVVTQPLAWAAYCSSAQPFQ